jgi:hypothetical protein
MCGGGFLHNALYTFEGVSSLCRLLMQHALFGLLTAIPALKRPYLALCLWVQRPPHEIGVPPAVRAGNRLNAGWPDRGG